MNAEEMIDRYVEGKKHPGGLIPGGREEDPDKGAKYKKVSKRELAKRKKEREAGKR